MGLRINLYDTALAGRLLLAEPYLPDSNFSRTVIYLCDHSEEGSIGFILNKETDLHLPQLLPEQLLPDLPIYQGGPVQLDSLHMLHRKEENLQGKEVSPGVFWGGEFDTLREMFHHQQEELKHEIKLFLGYSGWAAGQLEKELAEGSWLITDAPSELIFLQPAEDIWKHCMMALGDDYRLMANSPLDPQMN